MTLEQLLELCGKAQPGPWEHRVDAHADEHGGQINAVETRNYAGLPDPENSSCAICDCPNDSVFPWQNAEFIAAANPTVVAALVQCANAAKAMHPHAQTTRLYEALDKLDAVLKGAG